MKGRQGSNTHNIIKFVMFSRMSRLKLLGTCLCLRFIGIKYSIKQISVLLVCVDTCFTVEEKCQLKYGVAPLLFIREIMGQCGGEMLNFKPLLTHLANMVYLVEISCQKRGVFAPLLIFLLIVM